MDPPPIELEPKFFQPLSSSEVIGALIRALNPDDEDLTGRTARGYREGRQIKKDTEERIIGALAVELIDAGFLPRAQGLDDMGLPVRDLVASVVRLHVQ